MSYQKNIELTQAEIGGEIFYKISDVDGMRPFFMSIVSDSNHWMFISSNGGLSAGRKDAELALFPYYTDDKITSSVENTGSKTIIRLTVDGNQQLWEPFSERGAGKYQISRNLYKSKFGNQIIFEEINEDLSLCFQYQWSSSNQYGFVRKSTLTNTSNEAISLEVLDGVQNVLPYGVGADLQSSASNLADAYKRTELIPESGLGIFALSAIIVDKAEPSEALKANIVWSIGLPNVVHLLSSSQLESFRQFNTVLPETDIKGDKGAYFIVSPLSLAANESQSWFTVLNVNQNHAGIIQLSQNIQADADLQQLVLADIRLGTDNLVRLATSSDGTQCTADPLKDSRHFANVLFNIMRGGIFDDDYRIEKWDFKHYLQKANGFVFKETQSHLDQLPEVFSLQDLVAMANRASDIDFVRLATEYLPLKFSRRHGDPSRPWNKFSINTRSEIDGSKILDYQGNWRDIFQNWEALAFSYPAFIEGMITKFLNASTFDGYNPYRVTKGGFDWETIEPDNPWSYIGYWGDHQIIYLLKFFEFSENHRPGHIQSQLNKDGFVYANVPYRIKSYSEILKNPKDTIAFDHEGDLETRDRMESMGADGALLTNAKGDIYHVSFSEKLLATVLAKLSNFIPEGGIWMNTQRPEWNDANNALVGNGLSMVTLSYLRRFLVFFEPIFAQDPHAQIALSEELHTFFQRVSKVFDTHKPALSGRISDTVRKQMADDLGSAGSDYRNQIYANGFSGDKKTVSSQQVFDTFRNANAFLEHSIAANKRNDNLYHTYNLIAYDDKSVQVDYLSEMLEGQVAVLSSRFLSASQSLQLLDALKQSALYRPDQSSYILYPNKQLPKFLLKNTINPASAANSKLIQQLLHDGNVAIVERDINGSLHFNGNFRNATDVESALSKLDPRYADLIQAERSVVLQLFEEVFCHKEFTGRSGTFFGYEGLGSIYWHMVSKLLLAVQETCVAAIKQKADQATLDGLKTHFYEIFEGIGVHKTPLVYGAFPTDPYSHTPFNKGVQQPGMTGQVKEDIISRFGELGLMVEAGKITILPGLLRAAEFLSSPKEFTFHALNKTTESISLSSNTLAFTYCQVPFVYHLASKSAISVTKADGSQSDIEGLQLSVSDSESIFSRLGEIVRVDVHLSLT